MSISLGTGLGGGMWGFMGVLYSVHAYESGRNYFQKHLVSARYYLVNRVYLYCRLVDAEGSTEVRTRSQIVVHCTTVQCVATPYPYLRRHTSWHQPSQ